MDDAEIAGAPSTSEEGPAPAEDTERFVPLPNTTTASYLRNPIIALMGTKSLV